MQQISSSSSSETSSKPPHTFSLLFSVLLTGFSSDRTRLGAESRKVMEGVPLWLDKILLYFVNRDIYEARLSYSGKTIQCQRLRTTRNQRRRGRRDQVSFRFVRLPRQRHHRPRRYSLPHPDLNEALNSMGYKTKNSTLVNAVNDIKGGIDFGSFFELLTVRLGNPDNKNNLRQVFALFDDEKAGFISIKNLRRVVKEIGESIDDA